MSSDVLALKRKVSCAWDHMHKTPPFLRPAGPTMAHLQTLATGGWGANQTFSPTTNHHPTVILKPFRTIGSTGLTLKRAALHKNAHESHM